MVFHAFSAQLVSGLEGSTVLHLYTPYQPQPCSPPLQKVCLSDVEDFRLENPEDTPIVSIATRLHPPEPGIFCSIELPLVYVCICMVCRQ